MAHTDGWLGWALPVMRTGYAGRGLTYVAVAGLSLWLIFRGGEAQGTESAFAILEDSIWGTAVLVGIVGGLIAYAIWRLIDAAYDLERYGTDGEGIVARLGMVTTGLIHGALGVAAASVLSSGGGSGGSGGAGSSGGQGSSGGGSDGVTGIVSTVLGWPGGRWIVLVAGLLTLGAAAYYAKKAWKSEYRKNLFGNEFTRKWNTVLRIGVAAQAVVVGVAGGLLVAAGIQGDPEEAGGLGGVFEWLQSQAFGNVLVILLCVGLLFFAVFCFVNAAYRIIPALHDEDDMPTTLGQSLKEARS